MSANFLTEPLRAVGIALPSCNFMTHLIHPQHTTHQHHQFSLVEHVLSLKGNRICVIHQTLSHTQPNHSHLPELNAS